MQYEIVNNGKTVTRSYTPIITNLQKDYYERDGFLVLKNFITPDMCNYLKDRAETLIEAFDPNEVKVIFSTSNLEAAKHKYFLDSGNKIRFFFEEGAINEDGGLRVEKKYCINKIGHALHELDPAFYCFSHLDKITNLMQDLDIQDPKIVQSMYLCKQPNFGDEVVCHQDSTYLYVKGKPITGFWFALEDSEIHNGCLWALPGGHKAALKSRMLRDRNDHIFTQVYDDSPWALEKMIPLEVPRGSLIVLHGLLPHLSKENLSSRSRHAYSIHAMSGKDTFAEDNWLKLP